MTVSEDIKGKAADVWTIMSDFGGIKVGGPITSFDVKGKGVGMVRTIGMGGGTVVERLDLHDARAMAYAYTIVNEDSPLPVSGYKSNVKITDKGNGTCNVTWSAVFTPKGAPEADAIKAVEGIYKGGIARARKAVEG